MSRAASAYHAALKAQWVLGDAATEKERALARATEALYEATRRRQLNSTAETEASFQAAVDLVAVARAEHEAANAAHETAKVAAGELAVFTPDWRPR